MNPPTPTFKSICKIAGYSDEKINQLWLSVWSQSLKDFLDWIVLEAGLTPEQLTLLEKKYDEILNASEQKDLSGIIEDVLNETQRNIALQRFAQTFLDNLNSFYVKFREQLSFEQKQVVDAYLTTHHA